MSAATADRTPLVEIALSTYNGARFIDEQLDSYVSQTFHDWALVVRDDASSDDTVERIRRHARAHGYPLRFTTESGVHAGYPATFYSLFEQTRSPVVLFSDQDDVWMPEKIALTVDHLDHLPKNRPALMHSDLSVVDANLREIHPSYLRYRSSYPPRSTSVTGLLCWEYVTGCTMGVNARAREMFKRPPAGVRAGHDAWIALTCAALGTVQFMDRPTLFYRQHGANVIGADYRSTTAGVVPWSRLSLVERRARNAAPLARARALLDCHGEDLTEKARAELTFFANLDAVNPLALWELGRSGALPADRHVRRRVLWMLAKMQLKERLLAAQARFKGAT